jgi:hypothetical protein
MQSLFGFLFIMMIPVLLVGMIRPQVFADRKTGEVPPRKVIATGGVAVMLISLVMIGVLGDEPASAPAVTDESVLVDQDAEVVNFPVKEAPQELLRQPLGLSAEAFKTGFNNAAKNAQSEFRIDKINVERGPANDTFTSYLSKNNALIGTLDQDGNLKSITSISTGDGTIESGADMIILSALIVRAVSPGMDKKQAGDIALNLIRKTNENGGETAKKQVGNVEYFAMFSESLGFWFGAEGAKL